MAEAVKNKKGGVKTWWTGLKAEFTKIIWPDKTSIVKQTFVVVVITVILGVLISLVDNVVQFGLDKIIG